MIKNLDRFENTPKTRPSIITVIRMFREERGLSYEKARDEAIAEFRKRGWPIPEGVALLEGRAPIDPDKFRENL